VPDGVIDIVVKAYDDIDVMTPTQQITVTKGAPCTSASTCATGQKCEAGRCFWDPPTGQLGDECSYPQYCVTEQCLDAPDGMYCSQSCVTGVADSCPMGYVCEGTEGSTGFCITANPKKGCIDCSTGGDGRVALFISCIVLGLLLRRRR
jgi:hypothetical protein